MLQEGLASGSRNRPIEVASPGRPERDALRAGGANKADDEEPIDGSEIANWVRMLHRLND